MDGFDAFSAERRFQIKIEVRCVHANKQVGTASAGRVEQTLFKLLAYSHNLPVVAKHLHIAAYRQFFAGPPGLKAAPGHLRPAYTAGY